MSAGETCDVAQCSNEPTAKAHDEEYGEEVGFCGDHDHIIGERSILTEVDDE